MLRKLRDIVLERNLFMKSTFFVNLKKGIRTVAAILILAVTVSTVSPVTAQAKATDYTRDTEGWLEACQYVGKQMTKYKFSYGNGSRSTLEASIKNGRRSNCASYVSWCLQEFGVLKKGQTFFTRHGRIVKRFKSWRGKVEIIPINKRAGSANLKPGDIVGWKDFTHTNIYAGENEKGEKLWLDGGSAATHRGRVRRYYCADKKKTYSYLNKHVISFVIRIKEI